MKPREKENRAIPTSRSGLPVNEADPAMELLAVPLDAVMPKLRPPCPTCEEWNQLCASVEQAGDEARSLARELVADLPPERQDVLIALHPWLEPQTRKRPPRKKENA